MSMCSDNIKEMIGQTFTEINGAEQGSDEIVFKSENRTKWIMSHVQNCCESVLVEDICGGIQDLIESPILTAECVTSKENPSNPNICLDYQDSFTWTFYKFATIKGSVTIRWYGQSNGYYGEEVDLTIENP